MQPILLANRLLQYLDLFAERSCTGLRRKGWRVVVQFPRKSSPRLPRGPGEPATEWRTTFNAYHYRLAAQNREREPDFRAWLEGMIAYVAISRPAVAAKLRAALAGVAG